MPSVILLSDVPGLGQMGDQRKVKNGYARNYLLPERLAVIANANTIKKFEQQKEKLKNSREAQLGNAKTVGEQLSKVGLVFERPLGPGGRLFGSVTSIDIVNEISKKGIEVERKSVLMNGPLKSAGSHVIRVRVHSQVIIDIPVQVNGMEIKQSSEYAAPVEEVHVYGQEEDL
jgi:large subunit ribosomal protein L9